MLTTNHTNAGGLTPDHMVELSPMQVTEYCSGKVRPGPYRGLAGPGAGSGRVQWNAPVSGPHLRDSHRNSLRQKAKNMFQKIKLWSSAQFFLETISFFFACANMTDWQKKFVWAVGV